MHRVALLLIASAAFLAACATSAPVPPPQPPGKPLFITLQIEQHLNKYYRTVGTGRTGAYAVSEKGTVGFYAYCQSFQCRDEHSYTREALRGCEARDQGRCVILAVGRSIRQPYMTYRQAEAEGLI